jgi:hypothetical protein
MRILKTPDANVVAVDLAAQVNCALVTENKPCCHANLLRFLLKVTGELVKHVFVVLF